MSNATHPGVPLRYKPVKWSIAEPNGTVHIVTSFSAIHEWFVSHPEVDYEVCTIRRNGSVIHHGLRTP